MQICNTITIRKGLVINNSYDVTGNRFTKQLSTGEKDISGNVTSVNIRGNTNVNQGHVSQSEVNLYGSSRLGINKLNIDVEYPILSNSTELSGGFGKGIKSTFIRGNKFFELSNHFWQCTCNSN